MTKSGNRYIFRLVTKVYPQITAELPKNPNRLYAIPFFGFIFKILMLIPVWIELFFLFVVLYFSFIISSFYVIFTGRFWSFAYNLSLGSSTLILKNLLFLAGITDKYPGFSIKSEPGLLSVDKPSNPNKLFAFPFFGGVVRLVFLIPYLVYGSILSYSSWFGTLYAVKSVLFRKHYPEITYEIVLDSSRVSLASLFYFGGISDTYPSFKISMNHKTEKIILLILGTILFLFSNIP